MPHKSESINQENAEEKDDCKEETQDLSILPILTFGVLTDIQYADVEDGTRYDKKRKRFYRNSLNLVKEAISNWKSYENTNNCKFKFIIQLGDLIDGKAKAINESIPSVNKVLDELGKLFPDCNDMSNKLLHIWGNHEFYNFKRDEIVEISLNTAKSLKQNMDTKGNYYTYDVTEKLRLICLDFYEFSMLGYDETDPIYQQAFQFLSSHNKNQDLNSTEGLRGHALRFSKFNGSLSEKQTKWLEEQLNICKNNNIKVIICGHLPIHPQASDPMCISWDYKNLLELIWSFNHTVIAYFAGHDHEGGYFRDKYNIHHVTFAAILETPANSNAYATVKVYNNKVSVEGVGVIGYYEIYFN